MVAVLAVALVALALFDWNRARGWIGEQVKERTGRELVIAGDLEVRPLSLRPRVRAHHVTLSNAEWGDEGPMLVADRVAFTVHLPALLSGRIVFPEVSLGKVQVLLQRDAEGRRNWVLTAEEDETAEPVRIRNLTVEHGRLLVKDALTETDLALDVQTTAGAEPGVRFAAKGLAKGLKLSAQGTGGGLLSLQDTDVPYPLNATVALGGSKISFGGTITGIASLTAVNGRLALAGADAAALAEALDLTFPHTAPFKLGGRLERSGDVWRYSEFEGTIGKSDLRGEFSVDLGAARPALKGQLASKLLDLTDLGGLVGERPGKPDARPDGKVLPAEPIDLSRLQRMDAHVSLRAARIRNRDRLPIDDLDMKLQLVDGVLKASPLVFGVAGGRLDSSVAVDARKETLQVDVNAAFRSLHLNQIIPGADVLDESLGAIDGRVQFRGRGSSTADVLGSATGRLDFVSHGGQVSKLTLAMARADIGEIITLLLGGDDNVRLNCAVAAFNAKDGVLTSEALVVDTDNTYIGGEGSVNLREERLAFKLVPLPKDVDILSVRGPLHVRGTFAKPQIGLDRGTLVRKIGTAVLLGLLTPIAAILPTIDLAPAEGREAPCADLLQSLEANIKGGQKKPVPAEQKKRLKEIEKKK